MIKVVDAHLERSIALKVLRKYKVGICSKKADAAKRILGDEKLLEDYVQTIVDRRENKLSPKKDKKRLTGWKKFVNLEFGRKA